MEMERVEGRSSSQRERRKFRRIQDNIFVFCRSKPRQGVIEWIAKDISEIGLRFESDEFIPPSTLMELEIYQPLNYFKNRIVTIYVLAKIVWIKELEKIERYGAINRYIGGIKFTKISKQDRNVIANYVKERFKKTGRSL